MKIGKGKGALLCVLLTMTIEANNSVASEASHVAGGMAIGGISTAVVDRFFSEYAENRRAIGFWATTLAAVAVFGVEMAQNSDDVSGEVLDMGCVPFWEERSDPMSPIGSFWPPTFIRDPMGTPREGSKRPTSSKASSRSGWRSSWLSREPTEQSAKKGPAFL